MITMRLMNWSFFHVEGAIMIQLYKLTAQKQESTESTRIDSGGAKWNEKRSSRTVQLNIRVETSLSHRKRRKQHHSQHIPPVIYTANHAQTA